MRCWGSCGAVTGAGEVDDEDCGEDDDACGDESRIVDDVCGVDDDVCSE